MQFGGQRNVELGCIHVKLSVGLDLVFLLVHSHCQMSDVKGIRRLFQQFKKPTKDKDLTPNPKHVSAWSGNQ